MFRFPQALVAALCIMALTFCVDSTSAAAFKRVHQGDKAPTFALPALEGDRVDLSDHQDGPLTVVVFWALWSPNSQPLLEDVQKLLQEFGAKGMRAVAVNADGEKASADLEQQIRDLAAKSELAFPMAVDKAMDVYSDWGVIATPSTAFLGKDLEVLYEFSGHPTSAYEDMREQVMKALHLEEEVAAAAKPKRERYHAAKRVTLNYGLARTLFQRGQFAKAERKLEKVLKEDPAFPEAHSLNGLIQLGRITEGHEDAAQTARKAFAKAVELDATEPVGHMGLAHFDLADGKFEAALANARKSMEFTETDHVPHLPPLEGGDAAASEPQETATAEQQAPAMATAEPASEQGSSAEGTASEAGSEAAEADSAVAGTEDESTDEEEGAEVEELGATGAGDPALAAAYMDQAAKLLEEGQKEAATELLGELVRAYLAVPEGPGMTEKGSMMKMKEWKLKKP